MQGTEERGPNFRRYSAALQKLTELKDEQLELTTGLQQLEQLVTHGLVTGVLTALNPVFLQALRDIQGTKTWLQLVSMWEPNLHLLL